MNDYWPKQALAWLFCPAPGSGTLEYKATLLKYFPLKWFNFKDQQLFYAACPSKQRTTTAETSMQVILQKGRHGPREIFPDESLVSFSAIFASSRASPVSPGGDALSSASAVATNPNTSVGFPIGQIVIVGAPVKIIMSTTNTR
jgi:hypothetical protein